MRFLKTERRIRRVVFGARRFFRRVVGVRGLPDVRLTHRPHDRAFPAPAQDRGDAFVARGDVLLALVRGEVARHERDASAVC